MHVLHITYLSAMSPSPLLLLRLLKLSLLGVCVALFAWKAVECFAAYERRDTTSRVDVYRFGDSGGRDLPNVAICNSEVNTLLAFLILKPRMHSENYIFYKVHYFPSRELTSTFRQMKH